MLAVWQCGSPRTGQYPLGTVMASPEPRIISSRLWETRQKIDLVLNDPDANLTRLAVWSHAARYAMAYFLTDAQRDEFAFATRRSGTQLMNCRWP